MPTLKDKKAALLAKIARQKAKQKEQIFTIPTIKLSSQDKQRKAKKTFVPNSKFLAKKANYEDNMREFMTKLNGLSDDDFDVPPNGNYNNVIVSNGYKLFIKDYVKNAVNVSDNPNVDRDEIQNTAKNAWTSLTTFDRLIWVLNGYAAQQDGEWGRKQFVLEIKQNVRSKDVLYSFINIYLGNDYPYDRFVNYWKANREKEEIQAEIDDDVAAGEAQEAVNLQGTRLAVTDEERDRIDDLKERLTGYEDAATRLENKMSERQEILTELSHDELVKLARPSVANKTKKQLVSMLVNSEYASIEMEKQKEVGGNFGDPEYIEFMKNLKDERTERKAELDELSYGDLVLEATVNKTVPRLVQLILSQEFHNSRKKLEDKISKLGMEIRNLSLGKYVPRQSNIRRLNYNERVYREALTIQLRRLELETKSYDELAIHASAIGAMKNFKYKDSNSARKLLDNIILVEFTGANINSKVPKIDINEMKSVLRTLDEDQIHVLAYSNGITHPEKRGKNRNIESILHKEFPAKKIKPLGQLVIGRNVRNWSYVRRKDELQGMTTKELKTIVFTMGEDLPKGLTNEKLINMILGHEEYMHKLIPKEDKDKEAIIDKIVQITGAPASRYRLWSLVELKSRLDSLRDESQVYWTEMERDRLYSKLSQIVNIENRRYSKAKKWTLKKLRRELQKTAGSNWESYKPLIEDYAFVECMKTFQRYGWIEGRVTGVWLAGHNGGDPNHNYIMKDISIEEDGHLWYQANNKFFALQCNSYKKDRTQNGDTLTSYTQAGKQVRFQVGFTIIGYQHDRYKGRTHMVDTVDGRRVQRTFMIQDEMLFNKEKQYIRRSKQTELGSIQDILNSAVTDRTKRDVMKDISGALKEIAPMKNDYGIVHAVGNKKFSTTVDFNTPYMQILVDTLHTNQEQTNKEFFTRAAALLVYLHMPEAKTFRKNIAIEYYLPDILATLSPTEKFPEAFSDPNASGKFLDELTASINNKSFKLVRGFAKNEYRSQNPTKRTETRSAGVDFTRSIKTRNRIDACSNKARVNGVPEEDIVYYTEDGQIYCFTVDELYNGMLMQGDLNNPETGKPFDISFVKRFDELYNSRLAEDGLLTGYFQKKYGFNMDELVREKEEVDTIKSKRPIIATDLWEIIGKDIAELEDQMSNEKPNDGDEIDEGRETERRDKEVDEGTRETKDIDPLDACVYCKNHISDDSIKSIILHGDESRIIKFCSFKCFENKNDWSKFKAKRAKKKARKVEKQQATTKAHIDKAFVVDKAKSKESPVVRLSREEIKKRKKVIKKQVKDGVAAFDKIALPLMSKAELREFAAKKKIKIPTGLSKMGTASFLYKQLHPKSTKGILKEKTAEKKMLKIETRKEKKKRKSKEVSKKK
jgi:hypothetical protein